MSTVPPGVPARPIGADQSVIAVIGAGAAGTSFLHAVVKHVSANPNHTPPRIVVVEPRARPGPGYAYDADCPTARLNRPVSAMSVDYTDPGHFYRWLLRHGRIAGFPGPEELFTARSAFGDYLEDVFQQACRELTDLGGHVEVLRETALRVRRCPHESFQVDTDRSRCSVDNVVLCVGSMPARTPYRLEQSAECITSPYPLDRMAAEIPEHARVLVLGMGLSAVDVAVKLGQQGSREVVLASRHGLLPDVRCDLSPGNAPQLLADLTECLDTPGYFGLRRLFELLDGELRRNGTTLRAAALPLSVDGDRGLDMLRKRLDDPSAAASLQRCIVAMTPKYSELWQRLNPRDKKLFTRRCAGKFGALRSPMPPATAQRLLMMADSGWLRVHRGIRAVHRREAGVSADFGHGPTVAADVVVNATGRVIHPAAAPSGSLLDELVRSGLAKSHPSGGLDVLPETNEVRGERGAQRGLWVIGDLSSGVHFHTSSMEYVATQATWVAHQVVSRLPSRRRSLV